MIRPHRCFGYGACMTRGCRYAGPDPGPSAATRRASRKFRVAALAELALCAAAALGAAASSDVMLAGLRWQAVLVWPAVAACIWGACLAGRRARAAYSRNAGDL